MFFVLEILFIICVLFGVIFLFLSRKKSKYFLISSIIFFSLPIFYVFSVIIYKTKTQKQAIGYYQLEDKFLLLNEDFTYTTNFQELKSFNGDWEFIADEDGDYVKLKTGASVGVWLNIRDSILTLRTKNLKKFIFKKNNLYFIKE